ncbi:MAG: hypothetical protein GX595_06700 [Lentisphaerae bacterium]|nr:hypothetical protein [Lentisphaerota bacterium]
MTLNRQDNRFSERRLSALVTLLQDDNQQVASLAMEHLLSLGQVADTTIAEYQESQDPQLRQRVHQLSSILARRRSREAFIAALGREDLSLWDGIVQIHSLFEPIPPRQTLEARVDEIAADLQPGATMTHQIADLMREKEFTVPSDDILDVDLFLVNRVLETRYGHAALLCVLAKRIAQSAGWQATICLHGGRFCLIDRDHILLKPAEGWQYSRIATSERIHPCSRKDVLLAILAQLFMVALIDGQLKDLHHFGTILTALNGQTLSALPYPLNSDPS